MDQGTDLTHLTASPAGLGSPEAPLSLSPKVVLFWRIPWILLTVVVAGLAALIGLAGGGSAAGLIPALVLAAIGGTGAVLHPKARYRRWKFWVTDDAIELRHGLVNRIESSIPHFRVQHIDLRQGPLERLAGVTQLVISTASAATDATLPGVGPDIAGRIREMVLARAEADDAV